MLAPLAAPLLQQQQGRPLRGCRLVREACSHSLGCCKWESEGEASGRRLAGEGAFLSETSSTPPALAGTTPMARRAASAARRSSVCQGYLRHRWRPVSALCKASAQSRRREVVRGQSRVVPEVLHPC